MYSNLEITGSEMERGDGEKRGTLPTDQLHTFSYSKYEKLYFKSRVEKQIFV